MNRFQIFYCLIFVILSTGCNRQPTAKFRYSRESYLPGQVVQVFNESKYADRYRWTLPDGSQHVITNVTYTIKPYQNQGNYEMTLETFSRNGNKKDQITKAFTVDAGVGNLRICLRWAKYNHQSAPVQISINNTKTGTLREFLLAAQQAECGHPDCISQSLPPGDYTVSADNGINQQSTTVRVNNDECTKVNFHY